MRKVCLLPKLVRVAFEQAREVSDLLLVELSLVVAHPALKLTAQLASCGKRACGLYETDA